MRRADNMVSIIMPVHNGGRYLPSAVKSVLRQTHRDFELLIVDDGSTDDSIEVVRSIDDHRVKLLLNETQRGLVYSLNRLLQEASGELIFRMDADDVAKKTRLAVMVDYMNGHPDVGIAGSWYRMFGVRTVPRLVRLPKTPREVRTHSLFANPMAHPTVVFRASTLKRLGLSYDQDYETAEDYGLWVEAMEKTDVANVGVPTLWYRISRNSVTGSVASGRPGTRSSRTASLTSIFRRQFHRLGLQVSDVELSLHSSLNGSYLRQIETVEEVSAVRSWISKLRGSVSSNPGFDLVYFDAESNRRLRDACRRSPSADVRTLRSGLR